MVTERDAGPEARRQRIVSLLRAMQKELRVDELARLLQVSPLTVRRDLQALADARAVIRTHGGCIAAGRAALESEYQQRVARNFELKQAIGGAAAALVKPGSSLLMSDGSTTFHLVSSLVAAGRLEKRRGKVAPATIYSTSIALVAEVSGQSRVQLYLIGGRYVEESHSLTGALAEGVLDSLRADFVFLGADAVDARGRCLVGTPEEARLARAMMRSGRRRILLVDHTKVGAEAVYAYATLDEFQSWITTPGIDQAALRRYRRMTEVKEARP